MPEHLDSQGWSSPWAVCVYVLQCDTSYIPIYLTIIFTQGANWSPIGLFDERIHKWEKYTLYLFIHLACASYWLKVA